MGHNYDLIFVRDSHGNECMVVRMKGGDVVRLGGFKDKDGKPIERTEIKACHVEQWATDNGLDYLEVEKRAIINWDTLEVKEMYALF